MATYYVDPINGSNSNNGLGPDASHASNKPFQTIAKLIASSGAMVSGDTAYLAPGTYREKVTVGVTSPTAATYIIGDPMNSKGFKTAGGVLLSPGEVVWTTYTTDDLTTPTSGDCLDMNGTDFWNISKILFIGGDDYCIDASNVQTCTNLTIDSCAFVGCSISSSLVSIGGAAGIALNHVISNCIFFQVPASPCLVIQPANQSSSYDLNVSVVGCKFYYGTYGISISNNYNTGVDIVNCTFAMQTGQSVRVNWSNTGGTIANTVKNCVFISVSGVLANNSDYATNPAITEDYNLFACPTARTSVSSGSNSVTGASVALLMHMGWSELFGFRPMPMLSPSTKSGFLGRSTESTGEPSSDILGRTKPSGSGLSANANALKCWGAHESHDFGTRDATVYDAADASLKLTGPGDHDIELAVDATSTTISIKVRCDNDGGDDYGGTSYPQVILLDPEALGVSGGSETKTATSSCEGAWETLTFTAFTPSRKGGVILRCVSRSNTGAGVCNFDTISVS